MWQSSQTKSSDECVNTGLLRRFAPRNDSKRVILCHSLSLRGTSEQSAKGGNEEFPTVGTFMASEVKNNFSWQSSL